MIYILKAEGCENKVLAIKGVRAITGMGLKESKDLVEEAIDGRVKTLRVTSPRKDDVKTGIECIRNSGCYIEEQTTEGQKELKKLIKHAVDKEQFVLANDLMEVYKNHFGN